MNKFFLLFIIFMFYSAAAQEQPFIHPQYPAGQDFYEGGSKQLYKEIHNTLRKLAIEPCLNEEVRYTGSVLVRENSKISFVKDFDSVNITANKCAYDIFRKVLPHLKKWKPAVIDGKTVNAVSQFTLVPNHLFNYYQEGYFYTEEVKNAEFPGGLTAFRQEILKNFRAHVVPTGMIKRVVVHFVVGRDGRIEDVTAEGDSPHVNAEALRTVYRIKTLWKPATKYGVQVRARYKLPLAFGS